MRGQANFILFMAAVFGIMIFVMFGTAISDMANSVAGQINDPLYASYFKILPPVLYLLAVFVLVGLFTVSITNG